MELSAIMNIHELAVNRNVRQRANTQAKKDQEMIYEKVPRPAQSDVKNTSLKGGIVNQVQEHVETKEDARSKTNMTGNIIDLRM